MHVAKINSVLPQRIEQPLHVRPIAAKQSRLLIQPGWIINLGKWDVERGHGEVQDIGTIDD